MFQAIGLAEKSKEELFTLNGTMAERILDALSDEFSRRMLVSTISKGKTVQEISVEQGLPLSSCYRRARSLVREGLLMVERIVLTPEGTRFAIYRSSFKTVEMASDFAQTQVSVELNPDVAEKFRRVWYGLSISR